MREAIAAEARAIVTEAAQPVRVGATVKEQLNAAWTALGRLAFWRVRAAFYGEGGCWSAAALRDFQDRLLALRARPSAGRGPPTSPSPPVTTPPPPHSRASMLKLIARRSIACGTLLVSFGVSLPTGRWPTPTAEDRAELEQDRAGMTGRRLDGR